MKLEAKQRLTASSSLLAAEAKSLSSSKALEQYLKSAGFKCTLNGLGRMGYKKEGVDKRAASAIVKGLDAESQGWDVSKSPNSWVLRSPKKSEIKGIEVILSTGVYFSWRPDYFK